MDSQTPTRTEIYREAFFIALESCLRQLGHRKAPACLDDADEVARIAVAKFEAFAAESRS